MPRILVATLDDTLREQVGEPLIRGGYPVHWASSWEGFLRGVVNARGGLALVDAALPGFDAELLARLLESLGTPPHTRVLSGRAAPLPSVAPRAVGILARKHALASMDAQERRELRLLGLGPDALTQLSALADAPLPVVLEGERGTGKKRVARWLHGLAGRPGPFVEIDGDREALPDGPPGTWYLSGLEARSVDAFDALAGAAASRGWRLVAGSRRKLPPSAGRWSALHLRPLRERPDELRKLTRLYLDRHRRQLGLPRRRMDRALWALVRGYRWPGNVRELEGFIVQALTSCTGPVLRARELPPRIRSLLEPGPGAALMEHSEGFEEMAEARLHPLVDAVDPDAGIELHRLVIDSTERALLRLVLARTGGNQKAAADLLGVARNTLRTKAIHLGLIQPRRRSERW
ncbi:MAG: sigma 54-interacting transcriptional regulator [Alphaproteobacteria bacterium]|nr:sigma 54-interacting transcriptional regulator [Alphaproteobacteria bacterium]